MERKKFAKTNFTKVYNIIDEETGQVVYSGKQDIKKSVKVDSDYIMFFENGLELYSELWKTDQLVYSKICFHNDYAVFFAITSIFRTQTIESLQIGASSLTKSISRLVDKGFLIKGNSRGEYMINPMYSWRGDLRTRERLLLKTTFFNKN